ncbi:MAG TPA: type I 3-dehydroquinate dehydratase [Anaerolineae bacterium]|nr:type I 3-dehydroquinate dehydratase [Anaerolineae bacterium]HIQ04553.1 type I 3-dehydroquinate dehydratase [Anaerolineae bacterium]
MIAVALNVPDTSAALAAMQIAARVADLVELRLDLMREYDLPRLLAERPCPVVVTNRPIREGGCYSGSEFARMEPLWQAMALGAEHVDIEWDSVEGMAGRDRGATRLIVSQHDFTGMPVDLPERARRLATLGGDIVKVAGMARQLLDTVPVLETLAQAKQPTIAMAMGEAGVLSRLLALRYPACYLSYGALTTGQSTAPGQLSVEAMRWTYRAGAIQAGAAIYGLLAPDANCSPFIVKVNRMWEEAGKKAVLLPFQPAQHEHPAAVVTGFRKYGVLGYLVHDTYRETVLPALDELSSTARAAHAVNVILVEDGLLWGDLVTGDLWAWLNAF